MNAKLTNEFKKYLPSAYYALDRVVSIGILQWKSLWEQLLGQCSPWSNQPVVGMSNSWWSSTMAPGDKLLQWGSFCREANTSGCVPPGLRPLVFSVTGLLDLTAFPECASGSIALTLPRCVPLFFALSLVWATNRWTVGEWPGQRVLWVWREQGGWGYRPKRLRPPRVWPGDNWAGPKGGREDTEDRCLV